MIWYRSPISRQVSGSTKPKRWIDSISLASMSSDIWLGFHWFGSIWSMSIQTKLGSGTEGRGHAVHVDAHLLDRPEAQAQVLADGEGDSGRSGLGSGEHVVEIFSVKFGAELLHGLRQLGEPNQLARRRILTCLDGDRDRPAVTMGPPTAKVVLDDMTGAERGRGRSRELSHLHQLPRTRTPTGSRTCRAACCRSTARGSWRWRHACPCASAPGGRSPTA